eukprot:COSAG04_NODE_2369_length_4257_cov_2.885762_6_plen_376_part_01
MRRPHCAGTAGLRRLGCAESSRGRRAELTTRRRTAKQEPCGTPCRSLPRPRVQRRRRRSWRSRPMRTPALRRPRHHRAGLVLTMLPVAMSKTARTPRPSMSVRANAWLRRETAFGSGRSALAPVGLGTGSWGIVSPVDGPSDGGFTFREAIGKLVMLSRSVALAVSLTRKASLICRVPLQDEGYQPARWNANGSVRRRHVFQPEGTSNTSFGTCKYLQSSGDGQDNDPWAPLPTKSCGSPGPPLLSGPQALLQGAARYSTLARTFCPQLSGAVIDDFFENFRIPPEGADDSSLDNSASRGIGARGAAENCSSCPDDHPHMYGTACAGFYCCPVAPTAHCTPPVGALSLFSGFRRPDFVSSCCTAGQRFGLLPVGRD